MKKTAILLFLTLIISCDQYSDIINSHGTKLTSIFYTEDNDSWVEEFEYDSLGRLTTVSDNQAITGRLYMIEYDNNRISRIRTIDPDDNKEIDKDSISYTPSGQIEKIFSINLKTGLPERAYEYEYDMNGKLSVKKSLSFNPPDYWGFEKYYWENDNVVRVEEYNEDWELNYEFFFEYDNKVNYRSILPYLLQNPLSWSKNNITKSTWNDYYGDLDIICNPCITKYDYNLDGFPLHVLQEGPRKLSLKYE